MPRLLPRLLKWLERNPPSQPDYRGPLTKGGRHRPRSLWKPTRSADSLRQSFSLRNRNQSLLLDHVNIITAPKENARHKSLPPVLKLQKNREGLAIDHDSPREMSEQEKQWWSSPYLRMLASPVRRCMMSNRQLPSDLLIRLVILKIPTPRISQSSTVLVPDGLLHSKFATRVYGNGRYMVCWNEALEVMLERGLYKRLAPNLSGHSLLSMQISRQLRLRVLQEVEMLAVRLRAAPRALAREVILRRLTRSEWSTVKSTGRIPWEGASCILVVPPMNKDAHTTQRPRADCSDDPPEAADLERDVTGKALPPLPTISTLHPKEEPNYVEPLEFLEDVHVPNSRVPLYNGLSLFPSRSQRAALHEKLCEVLNVERRVRWKQSKQSSSQQHGDKPSHAFILFSSGKTVARADTVPLAIALWRIRMWEGAGWGNCDWLSRDKS